MLVKFDILVGQGDDFVVGHATSLTLGEPLLAYRSYHFILLFPLLLGCVRRQK
jgi:hypothetical protein